MSRRRWAALVVVVLAVGGLYALLTSSDDGSRSPDGRVTARGATGLTARGRTGERHRHRGRDARRGRRAHGPGLEVAIQDNAVFQQQAYYSRERAFADARRLGVSWLRLTVLWSRAVGRSAHSRHAPRRVRYDWTAWDSAVQSAREHGVHVELVLTGPAPAWASGNGRVGPVRPSATAYAAFAAAAAAHFRGLVSRYSVWNEPNYVSWIAPQSAAPGIYRALYDAGYAAIKLTDPGAQVLIGETAPFALAGRATAPLAFLRGVVGGRPLVADGYAHHPYDFTHPPGYAYPGRDNVTIGTLPRLFEALDRLARARLLIAPGGHALPVYLTEFGYFARGARALPAGTRAAYLRRGFAIAAARYPRVRQLLQYLLVAPPARFPGGRFDTSVLTSSGAPTPAFAALAGWAQAGIRSGRVARP